MTKRLNLPEVIAPVHCVGCGRKLGVAPSYRRVFRVMFCDELCFNLQYLSDLENASRDRLVQALSDHRGLSQPALAEVFGISRSRISQVLAIGDEDYADEGRRRMTSGDVREMKVRGGRAGGTAKAARNSA